MLEFGETNYLLRIYYLNYIETTFFFYEYINLLISICL